jgi:transcriptional regulator with XRE-family HTH domain
MSVAASSDHRTGVALDADRIRARLDELGWTQYRFGRAVDVDSGVISAWLGGRRNAGIAAVVAIADALDLTVDEVIGRDARAAS